MAAVECYISQMLYQEPHVAPTAGAEYPTRALNGAFGAKLIGAFKVLVESRVMMV
jgi:hypothetical protein